MIKFSFNKYNAFSLVELLLVFVLVIGMTTVVLKQIKKKVPTAHDLIMQINEVTQHVFLKSVMERQVYKVHLFFGEDNLLTHIGYDSYRSEDSDRGTSKIANKQKLRNPFYVFNCIVNGHDEMAIRSKEIWFLFYPEGYSQEVFFTIGQDNNDLKYNYCLNPFNGLIEDAL